MHVQRLMAVISSHWWWQATKYNHTNYPSPNHSRPRNSKPLRPLPSRQQAIHRQCCQIMLVGQLSRRMIVSQQSFLMCGIGGYQYFNIFITVRVKIIMVLDQYNPWQCSRSNTIVATVYISLGDYEASLPAQTIAV